MDLGTAALFYAVCTIVSVLAGAFNLSFISFVGTQKEKAEQLFRRRIVDGEEESKRLLNKFFSKIRIAEFFAAVSFALAFVFTTQTLKILWSGTFGRTVFSLIVLLILFAAPFLNIVFAEMRTRDLKKEIMSRF